MMIIKFFYKIFFIYIISNCVFASNFITIQSSTSLADSGFYDFILPIYENKKKINIKIVAVGTGQAIKNAKNGDADILITHYLEAEKKFIKEGYGISRIPFMYNDYILVGPKNDPEKLKNKINIKEVFTTIKEKKLPYLTRNDNSGTYKKELEIWKIAGIDPKKLDHKHYIDIGKGMGDALNMASNLNAYTLCDRSTWESFVNKKDLSIAFENNPPIYNIYSLIVVNPKKFPHVKYKLANDFSNWLISREGKSAISKFKINGNQAFFTDIIK